MIIDHIKEKEELRHFTLYVLIGALAVWSDNNIFNLLRNLNINMYVANFISVNCGLLISFICNTFFNFKKIDKLLKRGEQFFIIGYIGMGISMIFLHYGVIIMRINETLIKLISTIMSGLTQFVLNRSITYR